MKVRGREGERKVSLDRWDVKGSVGGEDTTAMEYKRSEIERVMKRRRGK